MRREITNARIPGHYGVLGFCSPSVRPRQRHRPRRIVELLQQLSQNYNPLSVSGWCQRCLEERGLDQLACIREHIKRDLPRHLSIFVFAASAQSIRNPSAKRLVVPHRGRERRPGTGERPWLLSSAKGGFARSAWVKKLCGRPESHASVTEGNSSSRQKRARYFFRL